MMTSFVQLTISST